MATSNNGQTIASSWEAVVGTKPEDNIFDEYWLLDSSDEGKSFLSVNGGRTINGPIEYAVNTTVGPTRTPKRWTRPASTCSTSSRTPGRNTPAPSSCRNWRRRRTRARAEVRLLPAKLENLRNSLRKALNEGCFSDGTGNSSARTSAASPRRRLDDPTTGTVGGINRGTYTFWRNQQTSGAKTSTAFDNLRAVMRTSTTTAPAA
jgi:hypothetical protein